MVTVNDYLAARDAEWMGLFTGMGLSVGVISPFMDQEFDAYRKDITYGTNNEFDSIFRDNMAIQKEQQVQRTLLHSR